MQFALLATFRLAADPTKANAEMSWLAESLGPVIADAPAARWLANGETLAPVARLLLTYDNSFAAQQARGRVRDVVEGTGGASAGAAADHGVVPQLSDEPTFEILREEDPQQEKGFVWRGFVWR
jgi:hypothetical protein